MADQLDVRTEWEGDKLKVSIRNGTTVFADRLDPQSAIARKRLLNAVEQKIPAADLSGLEQHLLVALDTRPEEQSAPPAGDDPGHAGDAALAAMPEDVQAGAAQTLRSPNILAQVLTDAEELGIAGEQTLVMTTYVLGTSRLLARPLAACVQGSSSSGKSHTIERVASMFPPEARLMGTDLTPNALYYLPEDALRHRVVFAGERSRGKEDERAEATRALREMISAGVLRKLVAMKRGDAIETVMIERRGPISYIESTTLVDIFAEDANRMLLLGSDDSPEQTRRVLDAIAASYAGTKRGSKADAIQARHFAMQRMLRRVAVEIPFAPVLAEAMPVSRPEARRAISRILGVVQSIALLHQFQRTDSPEHGTVITATRDDYRIARELLLEPLGRSLGGGLPHHVISFFEWLRTAVNPTEEFTTLDLEGRPGCRWKRSHLFELVRPLRGCKALAEAGKVGRTTKYRLGGSLPEAGAQWLPAVEDLPR